MNRITAPYKVNGSTLYRVDPRKYPHGVKFKNIIKRLAYYENLDAKGMVLHPEMLAEREEAL